MEIRINKYLSLCNVGSRRKIEEKLWAGEFQINDHVAKPGELIDDQKDKIFHNGKLLIPINSFIYIAVNKPVDYVSTTSDEMDRKTVMDLVKDDFPNKRLYPIGRLDKDSTGLILLTNDGNLALKLTHPRYHLPKVYEVTTLEKITQFQLDTMAKGLEIPGGKTMPAEIKLIGDRSFAITLHQGIKRQIREMCKIVGLTVDTLNRVSIGPIQIEDLPVGSYRHLTEKERKLLGV